jgi:hypothetical protein
MKVGMSGHKLGEGIDDPDHRSSERLGCHSGSPPQAPGPGHQPSFRGGCTPEFFHVIKRLKRKKTILFRMAFIISCINPYHSLSRGKHHDMHEYDAKYGMDQIFVHVNVTKIFIKI